MAQHQHLRHRAAELWRHVNKCSEGMRAANQVVQLLERDNAMFGLYLEREVKGERPKVAAASAAKNAGLDACAQLKRRTRDRATRGDICVSPTTTADLDRVCQAMRPLSRPRERRPVAVRTKAEPFALHAASRRHEVARLESPQFTARPLPPAYRGPRVDDRDVATRTVEWYFRKKKERAAAREERKRAAVAMMQPAPDLETSKSSWAAAKLEAARVADARAAKEALRDRAAAQRDAWKKARLEAQRLELEAQRRDLQREKNRAPRVRPRPDAPITRHTEATRAAIRAAKPTTPEPPPRPVPEDDNPFRGIEPLRLDPKVLALIGEDLPASAREQTTTPTPRRSHPETPTAGTIPFFDALSSSERGRKQCRDARLFQPASMRRVTIEPGIVLLTGNLVDPPYTECVICVLFDRHRFAETQAADWWERRGEALCTGDIPDPAS